MAISRIWKFPLELADRQRVDIPTDAVFLSAGIDGTGDVALWFAVDPAAPKRPCEVFIVGTGHPLPHVGDFLGTVIADPFVWHIFTGPGDGVNRATGMHYLTKGNGDG